LVKEKIMGTKRKQKGYSFNPMDWFKGDYDFNPRGAMSAWDQERKEERELEVIKGLLAKEKMKGGGLTDEENAVFLKIAKETEGDSTDFETVRAKPEFGGDDVWDRDYISGQIASEELDEFKTYAQADHGLDQVADDLSYSNKQDLAREDHLLRRGSEAPISGGMTDNAFASKSSKMSPNQKVAMVGLLKDFMTPQQDDPAPQVRGAGIIKGGGTPFPSLLAKKPERPKYVNKGLI